MTESPQQPKEQKPIIAKLDTKFVQGLNKYCTRIDTPTAKTYFFPVAVIKHSASPVGVYQLVDFKDLPDELLAKFGLQKIPAKGLLDWDTPQQVLHIPTNTVYVTGGRHNGDFVTLSTLNGDIDLMKCDFEFRNFVEKTEPNGEEA